ncbi:MAG: hypothetical protein A2588_00690 [Candidatus Veblenbacteria bacterium RIFOXYD1_FULL_43_11]|uniref:SUF system FeS cluster assembly SufBD core domain-containing protein n=1 Tax=Candidatus Veblenbacteria bacterium RIFOXYD1_FULL_43_11 TaxID=1802429 RepID=A0A1G2Q7J4_9BACT|nr:MAG: hypothetical protein A2588_00690 [Candidatus Veblenbacteria bacterium RIFOXYD1_FULL_43_11]
MAQSASKFMSDEQINLTADTTLSIAPRQVTKLIVVSAKTEAKLTLIINEGAGVHLIVPLSANKASFQINVKTRAQFTMTLLGLIDFDSMGDIKISLTGEQANAIVELAVVSQQTSQTNFNIRLEHLSNRTTGRINSRRVQQDKSASVLTGLLYVGERGNGTNTYLSDKVLLLGELSQVKSDPQLEILACDVKASHGATIGQISEEELFYLRSRGLPKSVAQSILVQSFLMPALIGVPLEIRDKLLHEVSIRQNP